MVGLEEFIEYMEKATLDRTIVIENPSCRKMSGVMLKSFNNYN
jgi:hypothetical protein